MKLLPVFPVARRGLRLGLGVSLLAALPYGAVTQSQSNVFSNLSNLVQRLHVGVPDSSSHGPKGIARADFDNDQHTDLATANTDGSVTLFFGTGGGRFARPVNLASGVTRLRGIVAADLDGDSQPDIAVTAPFEANIVVFLNRGARQFTRTNFTAWSGVRNLATGDFDGDGQIDLVAAGPNNGLRQYRWLGGGLTEVTNVPEVSVETPPVGSRFPKPVYAMKSFRLPGSTKDHLALTHADTDHVWLLSPNAGGALEVKSFITNKAHAHALDVGRLFHRNDATDYPPDLVAVLRDAGALHVFAGTNTPAGPSFLSATNIAVPGGPRAVEIVDLNGDGWNDLVVVVRNFDSIVTYANSNGTFHLASERPVGSSPRELVTGFFDEDQFPDLAVMNRDSADVSLLMAHTNSVGYRGVNHLYLVDGNVVGLIVTNFNGDKYQDVIQLHRASGDFSVRLANPDGTLQPPVFYTVGNVPSAQALAFVNDDNIPDLITANLGTAGIEKSSSVTVRLGNGDGTFGIARHFQLDDLVNNRVDGRLFALVPADFNRDGNIDLAVGFLDSRVAFLQGAADGSFTHVRTHRFVNQARGMVAADFDRDGDLDLACLGLSGEMWVIENPGAPATADLNLMTETQLSIQINLPPSTDSFGGRKVIALDYDQEAGLDLIVGSGLGAWLYRGNGDGSFVTPPRQLAGVDQFVSDLVYADLDRDGNKDLVISCRGRDCLSVFSRTNHGNFGVALNLDAPASKFIAAGDLDGDGETDLVGTGRVLWTALSGSVPTDTPPLQLTGQRPRLTNVVINEILAINTGLPVESDGDRLVDWVEIYNGSAFSLSPGGWKLRSTGPDKNGVVQTNEFDFPTFLIGSNSRRLIYFSENPNRRTLYHTTFRLPGDGGTLVLLNPAGTVVDRVEYPPQRPNISYARFRDGLPAFAFNPFPSDGRPNVFNGQVEPDLKFGGVDPTTLRPGAETRFFADVSDDVGVASLTMYYQRLADQQFPGNPHVQFSDDGEHGDAGVSDGHFGAELPVGLQGGSELQFYFEVVDLNDNVAFFPDEPEFALGPGEAGNSYRLGVGFTNPPIEISELVAANEGGLLDESNGHPDWIEIRNTSSAPVSLTNVVLTQQLGDNSRYHFPPGTNLAPGEHFVVFCDNNPDQGPRHAPFRLSSEGETIMLTGLTTNNSRTLIDWVRYESLENNVAWARLGAGGAWRRSSPTPYSGNVAASWMGWAEANGAVFTFAFPTTTNATYTVEHAPNLEPGAVWSQLQTIAGDGIEKVIQRPLEGSGFFRVKKSP